MDYLPAYLPQFSRVHNIMAGVSLGGHTAWRVAALASPGQVSAYAMIVGCPNLTSLLLDRLGIQAAALGADVEADRLDMVGYDRLERVMDIRQKRCWPQALAERARAGDHKVYAEFPVDTPVLLCNGALDPLVPAHFTESWVATQTKKTPKQRQVITATRAFDNAHTPIEFFLQDNTGHSCTKEMVARLAAWLGKIFYSG